MAKAEKTAPPPAPSAKGAAEPLAPFFDKENAPTKVYAKDIAGWTFYHYPKVDGERTRAGFDPSSELDDPKWIPNSYKFNDGEMHRVFPEGIYDVEVHNKEGKFITRRKNIVIGNPDRDDDEDGEGDDDERDREPGGVDELDNDPNKIIVPRGLKGEDAAKYISAERLAMNERKRAEDERKALEEDRKALRDNRPPPSNPVQDLIALQQALGAKSAAGAAADPVLDLYKKTNDEQAATIREMRIAHEGAMVAARAAHETEKAELRATHQRELHELRTDHRAQIQQRDTAALDAKTEHARALAQAGDDARERRAESTTAHARELRAWEDKYEAERKRASELEDKWREALREGDANDHKLTREVIKEERARIVAEAEAKNKGNGESKVEIMKTAFAGAKEAMAAIKDLGGDNPEIQKMIAEKVAAEMKKLAASNGG